MRLKSSVIQTSYCNSMLYTIQSPNFPNGIAIMIMLKNQQWHRTDCNIRCTELCNFKVVYRFTTSCFRAIFTTNVFFKSMSWLFPVNQYAFTHLYTAVSIRQLTFWPYLWWTVSSQLQLFCCIFNMLQPSVQTYMVYGRCPHSATSINKLGQQLAYCNETTKTFG